MNTIAANIKRYRSAKGWNMAELSRRCGKSVKMIEAGERPGPRPETLTAIAKALGCTVSDLFREPRPKRRA